jgi:hypothetical protein
MKASTKTPVQAWNQDLTPVSKLYLDGKTAINAGKWVACVLCEDMLREHRLMARYCNVCNNGYCQQAQGSFAVKMPARCIVCGAK